MRDSVRNLSVLNFMTGCLQSATQVAAGSARRCCSALQLCRCAQVSWVSLFVTLSSLSFGNYGLWFRVLAYFRVEAYLLGVLLWCCSPEWLDTSYGRSCLHWHLFFSFFRLRLNWRPNLMFVHLGMCVCNSGIIGWWLVMTILQWPILTSASQLSSTYHSGSSAFAPVFN
jgi:hypothetical protein